MLICTTVYSQQDQREFLYALCTTDSTQGLDNVNITQIGKKNPNVYYRPLRNFQLIKEKLLTKHRESGVGDCAGMYI